jgi:hypothetical protein
MTSRRCEASDEEFGGLVVKQFAARSSKTAGAILVIA